MRKFLFITSVMLFAMMQEAAAQSPQPAQGQPVSSSRDVISPPAAIQIADSTGTASSSAKDATGPADAAAVGLPASPGAGKADDKKQPKR